MLLRSIKLEGWRCFANAVSVGDFGDGLNIIHGPNGAGKSTLMMALVRAMLPPFLIAAEHYCRRL